MCGQIPPVGGRIRMLGSIPTYQFLQWMEVSGRLKAGARVFSSSGWMFSDCRRPMGVLIPPVSGRSGTLRGALAGELSQRVENSVRGKSACRQIPPAGGRSETLRHADLGFGRNCCILIKLRFADRHCETLHNWRIRLVVYGARLESVLV